MDDEQSMDAILRRIRERYEEDLQGQGGGPEAARSPLPVRIIEQ
jgi:hypothetical protein